MLTSSTASSARPAGPHRRDHTRHRGQGHKPRDLRRQSRWPPRHRHRQPRQPRRHRVLRYRWRRCHRGRLDRRRGRGDRRRLWRPRWRRCAQSRGRRGQGRRISVHAGVAGAMPVLATVINLAEHAGELVLVNSTRTTSSTSSSPSRPPVRSRWCCRCPDRLRSHALSTRRAQMLGCRGACALAARPSARTRRPSAPAIASRRCSILSGLRWLGNGVRRQRRRLAIEAG